MKWAPLAFAGLLGVTTACVVDSQHPTCPTKTISNIVANVRRSHLKPPPKRLTPLPVRRPQERRKAHNVPTPQFQQSNSLTPRLRRPLPRRKPILQALLRHRLPRPQRTCRHLSLPYPHANNQLRLLQRAYRLPRPNNIRSGFEAVACNISIDCETYLSMEGHLGPQTFNYIPNKPFGADMMLAAPSGYNYCQHVPISIDGRWPSDAIVVVDELKYTIRQGECIPGSPGDPGPGCP